MASEPTDNMTASDVESERFSDLELSIRALRSIRDNPDAKPGERVSAINALAKLTGQDSDAGQGPGGMTRAELVAEIGRLQALTAQMTAQRTGKA